MNDSYKIVIKPKNRVGAYYGRTVIVSNSINNFNIVK